jgi:hypothetical protein
VHLQVTEIKSIRTAIPRLPDNAETLCRQSDNLRPQTTPEIVTH